MTRDVGPYIEKSRLMHGFYYEGTCRNASVARWNQETERFIYRRVKFGHVFFEEILHPEDITGYDVFYPFRMVMFNGEEIPLEV